MGQHKRNNGLCCICGIGVEPEHNIQRGVSYFYTRSVCSHCHNVINRIKKKGEPCFVCERCGWLGYCDTHHRDGNHENNLPENIESLCPNCHRTHHSPLNPSLLKKLSPFLLARVSGGYPDKTSHWLYSRAVKTKNK